MALCMCGDYESEHDPPILGLPRRCRVRHYDDETGTGGRADIYTQCDCPGYEPEEQDGD